MCVCGIVMALLLVLVLAINDPPSAHQPINHRRILIACIYGDFAIADFQTAHACVQQLFVFIAAHELNSLLLLLLLFQLLPLYCNIYFIHFLFYFRYIYFLRYLNECMYTVIFVQGIHS